MRTSVNAWIRSGGSFDDMIDFDIATRDPAYPAKLLDAADSGGGLHPNDAGYAMMGDAINLKLFPRQAIKHFPIFGLSGGNTGHSFHDED